MTIQTRSVFYQIEGKTFEGVIAYDDAIEGERPLVLVAHTWAGRSDFEVEKAKNLAALGFTGFAMDLYGKGVLGETTEECQALLDPWVADRAKLQQTLMAIIDVAKREPEANASKVAAIGYCFGGLCVLDIARAGTDLASVISLHGLLGAPGNTSAKISAKVLALHGWDDPMATPADVDAFSKEMSSADADWQLHAYGGTMHAFTNPKADNPDFGTVYNKRADQRSWQAVGNFLDEVLN